MLPITDDRSFNVRRQPFLIPPSSIPLEIFFSLESLIDTTIAIFILLLHLLHFLLSLLLPLLLFIPFDLFVSSVILLLFPASVALWIKHGCA